jgi:uncharacterized repeat protein (TIGR03806 family)
MILLALALACTDTPQDTQTEETDTDTGDSVVEATPVWVPLDQDPPEDFAELHLFEWDPASSSITYNDGVVPYELNMPLFSDYALKLRAITIPEGESATYQENDAFDYPVGTLILKNFLLPADMREPEKNQRLMETRLLIRQEAGWEQWPYTWTEDGSSAKLDRAGEIIPVSFIDEEGETVEFTYLVPQKNQCAQCHELVDTQDEGARYITPIGPKARHLNRDVVTEDGEKKQLQFLADAGLLTGLPSLGQVDRSATEATLADPSALSSEQLDESARDYLDINCAHCHNPQGVNGVSSQLFLNHDNTEDFNLGICKKPGSAGEGTGGFVYDILPGNADESILVYRTETQELGAIMPLLGRSLVHDEGVAVLRAWIDGMEPESCEAE